MRSFFERSELFGLGVFPPLAGGASPKCSAPTTIQVSCPYCGEPHTVPRERGFHNLTCTKKRGPLGGARQFIVTVSRDGKGFRVETMRT